MTSLTIAVIALISITVTLLSFAIAEIMRLKYKIKANETQLNKPENLKSMYVIETMLADGPHWYGGIRTKENKGAIIQGPEWSPYWEDRKEFTREQAQFTFDVVCHEMPGAKIIPASEAKVKDAWKLEDNNHYSFRAKYMSKGLIVRLPGYTANYLVVAVTEKEFILRNKGKNELVTGDSIYIGRNSDKRVIVIGKKKEEVA